MRIALDVTCAARKERSGIGRYAEHLVRALGRLNDRHDIDLLYRATRWQRLHHRLPLPNTRFRTRVFGELLGRWLLRHTAVVHGLDARIRAPGRSGASPPCTTCSRRCATTSRTARSETRSGVRIASWPRTPT
ncbi:MAG: hypothetical protein U1E76_03320 [Planctomycetota bacterium]